MSVINQMLLDLDKRAKSVAGAQSDSESGSESLSPQVPEEVRPASAPKRQVKRLTMLLALLGLCVVLAGAWRGWEYLEARKQAMPELPAELSLQISDALLPLPPVDQVPSVEEPGAVPPAAAADGGTGLPPSAQSIYPPATPATGAYPLPGHYPPATPAPGRYPAAVPAGPLPKNYEYALPPARREGVSEAKPQPPVLSPQQQAEAETRRGQELARAGRGSDAVAAFERALLLDYGSTPARLGLATSLVEQKRVADAMTRLQEGLDENRANGALAMMLARLQIDRGETSAAIETLGRTLPYDRERADYQAFMAGLLQKEGRHREAVDYYLNALRRAPRNAAWWMGLGISLQGDNRPGEAREAYQRALASGGLSTDLQAFVQQRLEQKP
jgi:MSHA biogenesis protein MshN